MPLSSAYINMLRPLYAANHCIYSRANLADLGDL